ncbi:uncharacterized protein EDB91DRAFT_1082275 [Suillus paluster]|uniref:uncharacterized protein n=1 Tax=Suillus paluster TaxID=48578 RepID=UPI001B886313|nr:uncharacterized protein EDB91DRAFT_1082275 [Suillus paluster]KAG1739903.1 hypothetical protein EDB91DRAFT_1082275 [Suillus paluster]
MTSSLYSPPLKSLTPELLSQLKERSEKFLFEIISTNWKSQFYQTADELNIFSHTVEMLHDAYDTCKPSLVRFFNEPCQESEVINLFAPGFPVFLALSSATSGKAPKYFAKYRETTYRALGAQGQSIYAYRLAYRVVSVFRGDKDIVRKITVSGVGTAAPQAGTITELENIEHVASLLSIFFGIMLNNNYQVKHLFSPDIILQSHGFGSILLDDGFVEHPDLVSEEVADSYMRHDICRKAEGSIVLSVTEAQLVESIFSVTQDTIGQVMEVPCFKDVRQLHHTIEFFLELAQEPGMLSTTSRHPRKAVTV